MIEIKPKDLREVDDLIVRLLDASDALASISKAGARYANRMSHRLCKSSNVTSHEKLYDIDFGDDEKTEFVDKVGLLLKLETIESAYAGTFQCLFSSEDDEQ